MLKRIVNGKITNSLPSNLGMEEMLLAGAKSCVIKNTTTGETFNEEVSLFAKLAEDCVIISHTK
tara:strand:+ start:155 stop:346 length:192 start_codon:yes stop_codon:yes gene_type:complete